MRHELPFAEQKYVTIPESKTTETSELTKRPAEKFSENTEIKAKIYPTCTTIYSVRPMLILDVSNRFWIVMRCGHVFSWQLKQQPKG